MRKPAIKSITGVVACLAAMLIVFSGCGSKMVSAGGIANGNKYDDTKYIDDDLDAGAKSGAYKATAQEKSYLSQMKMLLSNDEAEFYMGSHYDIALYDKRTGSVYFSNEAIYDKSINSKLNDAGTAATYSQLSLTYYDSADTELYMNSYPDCVDDNGKNQVTVTGSGNQINVIYDFGKKSQDDSICKAITVDDYNKLKQKASQLADQGAMDSIDFTRFDQTYTETIYSQLDNSDKKTISEKYPNLKSLGTLYILQDDLTDGQLQEDATVSATLGIDAGYIKAQMAKTGAKSNKFEDSVFFEIPVNYSLSGPDLVANIDTSKIQCGSSSYKLTQINLLNFFGAVSSTKGYMFVPDRSGAIINNNQPISNVTQLNMPFYGSDFCTQINDGSTVSPYNAMPVFGVYDGNKSVFGIVESGAAIGGITASLSTQVTPYNAIQPWLDYKILDSESTGTAADQDNNNVTNYYSKKTVDSKFTIRYHMLYGNNADYSGMARYYQNYLQQQGVLKKSTANKDLGLKLDFIGAITKKLIKFGVPQNAVVAASTFDKIKDISQKLDDSGVKNLAVNVEGAVNGGLDFSQPTKIKVEKSIGGISGFNKLNDFLKSKNQSLSLGVDYTQVFGKSNGLNINTEISRYIDKTVAYYSTFYPSNLQKSNDTNNDRQSYLINPMSFCPIADKLVTSYAKLNTTNIQVDSIASFLNGNYNEKFTVDRQESANFAADSLAIIKNAGYNITLDGANDYALKYASAISDLPVTYGNYNLESYSVPFNAIVLHGYIDYYGPALNQQGDYKTALLQNIEAGAGLNYLLMTGDMLALTDTKYSNYFSVSSDEWQKEIISTYNQLKDTFDGLSECTITSNNQVASNVYETDYSNGTKIYVNYNQQPVTIGSVTVKAMSYAVAK